MLQISIENLSPIVLKKLEQRAQRNNRSLEAEIQTVLEQSVATEAFIDADIEDPWRKVDQARQRHAGKKFSDSVELLREDRER